MLFENRYQAGISLKELAERVIADKEKAVIMAIPRGGVEVAYGLSKSIRIPFTLVIVRKLGIPWNEEAGFGSVDPEGEVYIDEGVVKYLGISEKIIEEIKRKELKKIKERIDRFLKGREPDIKDKDIIVVDDGMATGYTTIAAMNYAKKKGARKVISLSPVCPEDALRRVENRGFKAHCYHRVREEVSFAVGMFYTDFHQLSDEEVMEIIERAKREGLFYDKNS